MIEQKDLTGVLLPDWLLGLARHSEGRNAMDRTAETVARPDAAKAIVEKALGHDEHRSGAHGELRQHAALLFHVDLASSQPTGGFTAAEPWRRERTAGNSRCPGARGSAHGPRSISRPRSSSACPSSTAWICDSTNGCTPDRLTVDRVFGSGE